MGVGSSLIYSPANYARMPELVGANKGGRRAAAACTSPTCVTKAIMCSMGVDELIEISRQSGAPAEIYHLKGRR